MLQNQCFCFALLIYVLSFPLLGNGFEKESERVPISGFVFSDSNLNGRMDPGEKGIPNVVVSDQVRILQSGPDGGYALKEKGYGLLFISVPAGFRPVTSFWRRVPEGAEEMRFDFALAPVVTPDRFSFIHASDTHLSQESLPRFQRFKKIVADRKPAFVLITGDLIKDALRVSEKIAMRDYELFLREIEDIPVPVRVVPGNHEIFGIERHKSLVSPNHSLYGKEMYRSLLGPNYYSFTFGRIHFIGLDTVDIEDLWYYGHVDERQLAWLEQDLSVLPPETTVVTFNHIPFYTAAETVWNYTDTGPAPTLIKVSGKDQFRHIVSNTREVMALFGDYRLTLALAGHTHIGEKLVFRTAGYPTRFHQSSAVVGPVKDKISGVFLYRVEGDRIDNGEFIPLDEAPID